MKNQVKVLENETVTVPASVLLVISLILLSP